jgi:hypothetical protein
MSNYGSYEPGRVLPHVVTCGVLTQYAPQGCKGIAKPVVGESSQTGIGNTLNPAQITLFAPDLNYSVS